MFKYNVLTMSLVLSLGSVQVMAGPPSIEDQISNHLVNEQRAKEANAELDRKIAERKQQTRDLLEILPKYRRFRDPTNQESEYSHVIEMIKGSDEITDQMLKNWLQAKMDIVNSEEFISIVLSKIDQSNSYDSIKSDLLRSFLSRDQVMSKQELKFFVSSYFVDPMVFVQDTTGKYGAYGEFIDPNYNKLIMTFKNNPNYHSLLLNLTDIFFDSITHITYDGYYGRTSPNVIDDSLSIIKTGNQEQIQWLENESTQLSLMKVASRDLVDSFMTKINALVQINAQNVEKQNKLKNPEGYDEEQLSLVKKFSDLFEAPRETSFLSIPFRYFSDTEKYQHDKASYAIDMIMNQSILENEDSKLTKSKLYEALTQSFNFSPMKSYIQYRLIDLIYERHYLRLRENNLQKISTEDLQVERDTAEISKGTEGEIKVGDAIKAAEKR